MISGKKTTSATKFIDFFVHDILDYTLLNQQQRNFLKNMANFDIREAIQEILDIQQDKITMKQIKIKTEFKSFGDSYKVKTDMKRLQ